MPTPLPTMSPLPFVASLRGVAAFMVVLFHFRHAFPALTPILPWTDKGYLWVDLFFLLSGMVIAHVHAASFDKGIACRAYLRFLVLRLARIYPLHVLALLLMIGFEAISWALGEAQAFSTPERNGFGIVTNLLLVQAWRLHAVNTWNGPAWSISAEWAAYLLFPLLVLRFARRTATYHVVLLGLAMSALALLAEHHGTLDLTHHGAVARCLAGFIGGMALEGLRQHGAFPRTARGPVVILAGIALCAASALSLPDGVWPPLFALLILGFSHATDRREPRMLAWVGERSYALYMLHIPLLLAVANGWRLMTHTPFGKEWGFAASALGLLALSALALAVAALATRFVERPARRAIRARWAEGPTA